MEITVRIPENLDEITLGQYQKYLKVQDENEDDTFIAQKMIEIFCGARLDQVMNMRFTDVQEITHDLVKMFEEDQEMTKLFTMDKVEYGFIPNLDELSFGEFVDLDSYLGDWQEMHKAMQVLYRPVDVKSQGRYNVLPYRAIVDDTMKDMPLSVAIGAVFFLLNLGKELSAVMMDYLHQGKMEEHTHLREDLVKNGVGIHHFGQQVRGILKNLKISPSWGFIKS